MPVSKWYKFYAWFLFYLGNFISFLCCCSDIWFFSPPFVKPLIDVTHPDSSSQKCTLSRTLSRPVLNGRGYQKALKCFFGEVRPWELWVRGYSCTSVVVCCVFSSSLSPFWTQMEIHLSPVPSWLVLLFLFPFSCLSAACSQEPVCQPEPRISPSAYQGVYPFPAGAVLHLQQWQPIATPRVLFCGVIEPPKLTSTFPSRPFSLFLCGVYTKLAMCCCITVHISKNPNYTESDGITAKS